jgi:hypothetical protein
MSQFVQFSMLLCVDGSGLLAPQVVGPGTLVKRVIERRGGL